MDTIEELFILHDKIKYIYSILPKNDNGYLGSYIRDDIGKEIHITIMDILRSKEIKKIPTFHNKTRDFSDKFPRQGYFTKAQRRKFVELYNNLADHIGRPTVPPEPTEPIYSSTFTSIYDIYDTYMTFNTSDTLSGIPETSDTSETFDNESDTSDKMSGIPETSDIPDNESDTTNQMSNFLCCICMDRTKKFACQPCGHLSLCNVCAQKVKSERAKCPICNQNVTKIQHIYY